VGRISDLVDLHWDHLGHSSFDPVLARNVHGEKKQGHAKHRDQKIRENVG
jgi:hypothetical protein